MGNIKHLDEGHLKDTGTIDGTQSIFTVHLQGSLTHSFMFKWPIPMAAGGIMTLVCQEKRRMYCESLF